MALADAVPNFREIPGQLRLDAWEGSLEYAVTVLVTVGMIASLGISIASLLLIIGFGTELADSVLGFTWNVPLIGETLIVPGLALTGTVVSSMVFLQVMSVSEERIYDDIMGIFLFNAITLVAAAWNTNLSLPNSIKFTFVLIAGAFVVTWLVGVVASRR